MRFANPHSLPDTPSQRSVLIVNPSEDICLGLTDRLTARGYHAESVQDGRMCLERIRPRVFSAVLVSAELPDQDGLSLLDTIRTIHPGHLSVVRRSIIHCTPTRGRCRVKPAL
jgi:DNA-binding NtrC family response regulator